MSGSVYEWKPMAGIKVDPQIAGEHLEILKDKLGGTLEPPQVLADARNPNSPLHGAFEWDDSVAAEKYRVDQAAHMIRMLVVTVKISEREPAQPVRAFVSVKKIDKPQYVSLETAMSDTALRAQVVEAAWKELLGWRERHRQLKELSRIFAQIDTWRKETEADAA